jgi:2-hydroxy-3-keto-5-methylthiopentenyl-1-phosphate phosphatase
MNKKGIIAIVYDFDGTLSPLPMQEYTVLPQAGITVKKFWEEVKNENTKNEGEEIITYMMLMLKKANERQFPITKEVLGALADKIKFFPGIKAFFPRISDYVKRESRGTAILRHYIISSGLMEILRKLPIRKYFDNIFASEYAYDHYGAAQYPKLVVTDTVKTQFLFRINKGLEKVTDSINQFMDEGHRPIPFQNILYIGDGLTDVPCMTVTTKQGGYAIAVYGPHKRKGLSVCRGLFKAGRVDFIAPADYSRGSKLEHYVKLTLKTIIQGIQYGQAQQDMLRYYMRRRGR